MLDMTLEDPAYGSSIIDEGEDERRIRDKTK
jgi:hypothetical protein